MKIVIDPLDSKSIDKAIKELTKYKSWVKRKETELLNRLASMGATKVDVVYQGAKYDGDKDISVSFNVSDNKVVITAQGESVAFIEFGAGVYYNGSGSYPLPLPSGVVGIGQYGKGKGKRKAWGYYPDGDKANGVVITHGNPSAKAFYQAELEIAEQIGNIAREVFKS